jgi:hypothetical protein
MFKHYLLFSAVYFCCSSCYSQIKNILIGTDSEPEEVSIAINPKNTNQIIAGANLASYYYSNDAGLTWTRKVLKCEKYNVYGDPVVFWDTLQNAYFMHLSFPNPKITPGGSWVDRIVVNKSSDFGQTYNSCFAVGKSGYKVQDKHWASVNPKNNDIHVSWTQFDKYESSDPKDTSIIRYSRSSDGGETWTEPKKISYYTGDCLDKDNTVEGAVPCIGPKGEVYIAWAGPKGLVFNRSLDNGNTWLEKEKILDSIPGGWDYEIGGLERANGMPFTACDNSNSEHKGRVYICWGDTKFGTNNKDVFLTYSDDGGETWVDRILVTYFPNHKQQFMPSFTIDQTTGYLYFLFYDRRNFATGNLTDVYVAVSRDGGKTFNHHKINELSFLPHKEIFFGDYIGISAHNGIVRPMWMQMDETKKLGVYTALITDSLLLHQKENQFISFDKTQPVLFAEKTKVSYNATIGGTLTAYLYKATDPKFEVKVAEKKKIKPGPNSFQINFKKLNLQKGTYVLMLYNNNTSHYVWIQEE